MDQDSAIDVVVGSRSGGGSHFDGMLDDILLSQRAISLVELAEIVTGNSLPDTFADSYILDEDVSLAIDAENGVLANDVDSDSDQVLTATLLSGPDSGVVNLSEDGSFTYTPNANYFGGDSFTYQVFDGIGLSDETVVDLQINPVNDAPTANPDDFQGSPGETLNVVSLGVLVNDSDIEIDVLQSVPGPTLAANGTVTLNTDGSFTYVPDAGFSGTDVFGYIAVDSAGAQSAETLVTIRIVPPPIVGPDTYVLNEDTTLVVSTSGLLENDTDVSDAEDLQASLVSDANYGLVVVNADGTFSYTPDDDFFGIDSFTYRATDAGNLGFADGIVSLTVNAVNDAPVSADDLFLAEFQSSLTENVLANDTDIDGDALTATLVQGPLNGTIDFQPDGSFVYTPDNGFEGSDSFSYFASDASSNSSTATTNINVLPFVPDDPDLLVHLLLDDGASPATDSSGLNNNGTLLGPVYQAESGDSSGSSLQFDGVDDLIDLGFLDVAGTGITMAAWFKADSFPENTRDARIISKASSLATNDHIFMLGTVEAGSGTRLRARISIDGTARTLITASGDDLALGQWYHAAATYDGERLRLYLNGEEVRSQAIVGAIDQDPNVPVAVGSHPGGARLFDGLIDDVRILQRAMDPIEILNIASGADTADPIPTQPGELNGFALNENRVDLNWLPSTDNFGVVAYEVFRDSQLIATVTTTSFTDTTVVGGSYIYTVEAIDADGFRSPAASVEVMALGSTAGVWWDTSWPYRTLISVGSGEFPRTDAIVERAIDFDQLIADLGGDGVFDPSTMRCHEVDVNGAIVATDVYCQSDGSEFLLQSPGFTEAGGGRYFHVYFDVVGGAGTEGPNAPLVRVTDNVPDEGQASFRIETTSADMYFHKQGAGFSSWVDNDGIDWIGYNPTINGSLGTFRGIPNMVPPALGGHFHPGETTSTSTLVEEGLLKATIRSETIDGLWEGLWEFYPHKVNFTVLKVGSPYWVLYEGVPGGVLDLADSTIRSSGSDTELSAFDTWGGDLLADEWAIVTASEVNRSLYVAHLDDDAVFDSYRPASNTAGQMTILGFGRQGATSLFTRVPERFTFGLIDTKEYETARQIIESDLYPLTVGVSNAVAVP